jgi:hypothetical protein
MEQERLQQIQEGGWSGRAGTFDTSGGPSASYIAPNATMPTPHAGLVSGPGSDSMPQSLRLKKKNNNNEQLPPLDRVQSAPQV